MTTRRTLPPMKPCPDPRCKKRPRLRDYGRWWQVDCGGTDLGWQGPTRRTPRAAILAWNRRSDAEENGARALARWLNAKDWFLYRELFVNTLAAVETGDFRKADEVLTRRNEKTPIRETLAKAEAEAERRGAEKLRRECIVAVAEWLSGKCFDAMAVKLLEAHERGEILPAKGARKR